MTDVDLRPALNLQYVLATSECGPDDVVRAGGKAVGLGSLLRAGQRVPTSFVVTTSAYFRYTSDRTASEAVLAAEVRHEIAASYAALCGPGGPEVTVAVRSSATVEDSADASFAGQFRTFLGVRGIDEVVEQVRLCFDSAAEPHVDSYRSDRRAGTADPGVAVVVQELVDARAAGVMFTQHPRTGDRSLVVIESSYGLGESVVGGEVTPDLFEVNKVTRALHQRNLGTKATEHLLAPNGRSVVSRPVEPERRQVWSITDAEVDDLVAVAIDLESRLGRGLDIEWAIGSVAGQAGPALFVLQVRPITVKPGNGVPDSASSGGRADQPSKESPIDAVLRRLSTPGGAT